jgi:uncharacterized NAD(P)/FAD-binding protein YdhS
MRVVEFLMSRAQGRDANEKLTIAIIGGGFTGATLAAQLLRHAIQPLSVVVIERAPTRGRGVAYSTMQGWHLLNVPAGDMSAFADDRGHLLRWAQANFDSRVGPESFLPRRVYGQYIESLLKEAAASRPSEFEWKCDQAVSVVRSGNKAEVGLLSAETVIADRVILALGNFPPSNPPLPGRPQSSPRYIQFAWSAAALEGVENENNILLIGSGLTAVDLAVALRAREFRGTIHVLSRRGLLPHKHAAAKKWPAFWNEGSTKTALGLMRLIRKQVKSAYDQGCDWRAVIDSLRPFTQQIWHSLPRKEQRRFLRHARPYWEVHRHRIAPEIGGLIGYQLVNHHIQAHAGRIIAYKEDKTGVDVTYRDRKSGKEQSVRVDRVINCTGPETDCRRLDNPLLASLQHQGFARPDPLFLGLDVSEDGALIDTDGTPSDFLYTVGPPRKGSLWETTAVPEIREEVAELVAHLLGISFPKAGETVAKQITKVLDSPVTQEV